MTNENKPFNYRECWNEISDALKPIVEKYLCRMPQYIQEQWNEGLITEYEALSSLDPEFDQDEDQHLIPQ